MSSPLAPLSSDLKDHVLGFLPLQSCLRYSQVSHQGLNDVLPHLKRRRSIQFCERYAYQMNDSHNKLRPYHPGINCLSSIPSRNDSSQPCLAQPLTPTTTTTTGMDSQQIHIVSSVQERIESLYRALPSSHSKNELVRKLWHDLKEEPPTLMVEEGIVHSHFPASLQELHTVTLAHRYHEELLRSCTIDDYLPPASRAQRGGFIVGDGHPRQGGGDWTTTLDQYLGDVLLAYFMMGHVVAGMVEGRTSHTQWTDHLLRREDSSPQLWYKRWVFLHSCILRTFPLTSNQLRHYKLPIEGIIGKTEPQNIEYIHPHYCFLGGFGQGNKVVEETTKVVSFLSSICVVGENDFDPIMGDRNFTYRMDLRWYSFGPLGPAFRARDHIQSVRMLPGPLTVILSNPNFAMAPTWVMVEEGKHTIYENSLYHAWFTSEVDTNIHESETLGSWFLRLPQICYKSRPMTVEPPMISFCEKLPSSTMDWERPDWIGRPTVRLQ